MTNQLIKSLILSLLFFIPFEVSSQDNQEYEMEEIKVINKFLKIMIGEQANSTYAEKQLSLYFNTQLTCKLNEEPLFKGDYKSNNLIKKLENNYLGIRTIDSTLINKIENINLIFGGSVDYSVDNLDSDKIIGTLNISRISFNNDLTIGYFYYSVYCGEECGWGDLIKIEKQNGNWEIKNYLISWIS